MTNRIAMIEPSPNSDIFIIHLGYEMKVPGRTHFTRPLRKAGQYHALGKPEQQLLDQLLTVDGVSDVSLDAYEIQFTKARMFGTSNVIAGVMNAFKNTYGEDVEVFTSLTSS